MTTVLLWPQMLAWAAGLSYGWGIIYYGAAQPGKQHQLFGNGIVTATFLGLLGGAASIALVPRFLPLTPLEHTLLVIGLAMLPLSIWTDYLQSQIQSTHRFGELGLTRVCAPVVVAAILLILWLTHHITAETAVIATLAGNVLTTLLALSIALRAHLAGFAVDAILSRQCLAYGAKMHLGTLAGIANGRIDQLIMTAIVSVKVLGLYAFAVTLSEMLNQVSTSISIVLLPKASESEEHKRLQIVQRAARFSIMIGLIGGSFLYVAAPMLVRLIWGLRFLDAVPAIRVLIPGTIALGLAQPLCTGLRGAGKPAIGTYAELAALIVMVPLLLAWIPKYSLLGAAWASTLSYFVNLVTVVVFFTQEFGFGALRGLLPSLSDYNDIRRVCYQIRGKLDAKRSEAVFIGD